MEDPGLVMGAVVGDGSGLAHDGNRTGRMGSDMLLQDKGTPGTHIYLMWSLVEQEALYFAKEGRFIASHLSLHKLV